MNKLLMLVALALALTFGFGGQASATPLGHRFCEQPLTSPEELATKLDRSLAIDPTGNRALEGCRANPLDFLDAWKYEQTGVTQVSELPAFVRRFVEVETEPGLVIPSACVRVDGNGVVVKCEHRQRHPGEKVYGIDGVAFLLEDCVNPINLQLEDVVVTGHSCVEVVFYTKAASNVRIAHMDDVPAPSTCLLLEGPGYGEPLRGLPQDCPDRYMRVIEGREVDITCSWRDDERANSRLLNRRVQVQNISGSFVAKGEGWNTLTLPYQAMNGAVVICYELPDGTVVALGVRRHDYVNGVATIPADMVYGPNPAVYRGN